MELGNTHEMVQNNAEVAALYEVEWERADLLDAGDRDVGDT